MASASIARSPWLKTLALLAAVATFAGCKKEPAAPTAGGTTPAAATAGEIAIGHYGSLTGGQATFGRSTDEGILLAVNEINAAGGLEVAGVKRKVKLVSEDTESKAEKADSKIRPATWFAS